MAKVVACLDALLAEINAVGPRRDKASDGAVGDQAHQDRSSDHNPDDTPGSNTPHTDTDTIPEIHARDYDGSGPWVNGATTDSIVAVLVRTMKALGGASPLAYVIWDHAIFEYPDWKESDYQGDDPHTSHVHASARYGSGAGSSNPENYTGDFGIRKAYLMLDTDDKTWLMGLRDGGLDLDDVPNLYGDKATNPNVTVRTALKAAVSTDVKLTALTSQVASLQSRMDTLIMLLQETPPAA